LNSCSWSSANRFSNPRSRSSKVVMWSPGSGANGRSHILHPRPPQSKGGCLRARAASG